MNHDSRVSGIPQPDSAYAGYAPEDAGVARLQTGDDEARVGSLHADFDAGDDPLDAVPTRGTVEKLLEAAEFAVLWSRLEARLRARFQGFDMTAQGRGRCNAENEVDAIFSAPVNDFGTAIMAVGAQQDFRARPVTADRSQKPAQEGVDLTAVRPLGRPQHSGDESAIAIEDDDRRKAMLVIMGIEQTQLLPVMHRIESVIYVENDPLRNLLE